MTENIVRAALRRREVEPNAFAFDFFVDDPFVAVDRDVFALDREADGLARRDFHLAFGRADDLDLRDFGQRQRVVLRARRQHERCGQKTEQ